MEKAFGSHNIFSWSHDYLVKVLTTGNNRIVKNPRLVQALKLIKREDFVPDEFKTEANMDKEVEIGFGQRLSKPTVLAQLIEILSPKAGGRVLDVGTGSGYSAALLALTVGENGKVFSLERQQYLLDYAKSNLRKYPQIKNVEIFFKDGATGLPERAPFDSIHFGAAIGDISEEVLGQLNIGGSLVAPVTELKLMKIVRTSIDEFTKEYFEGFILDTIEEGIG